MKKKRKYELIPCEIPNGDELFKWIINDYILQKTNLNEKEILNLSSKYQVLSKEISLISERAKEMKNKNYRR